MIKKSFMIATAFTVAIIGQSCSKETTEKMEYSKSIKKSLPTNPQNLIAELDAFSGEVQAFHVESAAVTDMELEYGVELLEATFNYQYAYNTSDLNLLMTNGFATDQIQDSITIDVYTDAAGEIMLTGNSAAAQLISLIDRMEEELESGQFLITTDFKVLSQQGSVLKVGVSATKVYPINWYIGPITTSHKIYNDGYCDSEFRAASWKRLVPPVMVELRQTYSLPIGQFVFHHSVLEQLVGFSSYRGPKTSTNYCGLIIGSSTHVNDGSGCYNSEYSDRCIPASEMNDLVGYYSMIGEDETPSGRVPSSVYVGNRKDQASVGGFTYYHYLANYYAKYGNLTPSDFNNKPVDLRQLVL